MSLVRPLSGGGVLVNDIARRQLVLLDSEFRRVRTVVDSSTGGGGTFSGPMSGLIPYAGDSSLIVDPRTLAMMVVDAAGEVARVMAVPSVQDAPFMVGGPFGSPAYDPRGRIVFRGVAAPSRTETDPSTAATTAVRPVWSDSAPVYRVDVATRKRETLTYVRIPQQFVSLVRDGDDRITGTTMIVNPLPMVDDWAVLPDGRLAVVRGRDYHVEWLSLDGHWTVSEKVPYRWERLNDDAKQRLVDSAQVADEQQRGATSQTSNAAPVRQQSNVIRVTITMVPAKELPDYRPAFRQGAVRADDAGNVWVRTTAPSEAGPIYDVINDRGVLIDRVRLPYGRVISGFGKDVVFMGVLDERGARLEMAKIR